MIMQLPGYPTDANTVESLFVWAAIALDNKKYPAVILNDSIAGTSPISLRTGRITASAKFNEPYLRVTADIPLDSGALNISPLYLAAKELVEDDSLPTALEVNLGTLGAGTPTPAPLYTLDEIIANIVFWTRGESMSKTGFGGMTFADVNGGSSAVGEGNNNYVAYHNGHPGLLYANDTAPNASLTGLTVTEYSIIFAGAFGQYLSYAEVIRDSNSDHYIYLGPTPSIRIGGTAYDFAGLTINDDAIHVYHLTLGPSEVKLYVDGVLQETLPHSETLQSFGVDYLYGDFDDFAFSSDLVIVDRVMSDAEVASTYTQIATHRGLV